MEFIIIVIFRFMEFHVMLFLDPGIPAMLFLNSGIPSDDILRTLVLCNPMEEWCNTQGRHLGFAQ